MSAGLTPRVVVIDPPDAEGHPREEPDVRRRRRCRRLARSMLALCCSANVVPDRFPWDSWGFEWQAVHRLLKTIASQQSFAAFLSSAGDDFCTADPWIAAGKFATRSAMPNQLEVSAGFHTA